MSLDGSEGDFMATSSITANFYTDDPKAANKIVHALFSDSSVNRRRVPRVRSEVKHTPAGDKAFFERLRRKIVFFLGLGENPALHSDNFDFDESVLPMGADFFEKITEGWA